jgi:DNA-binding response OmpR family regulator
MDSGRTVAVFNASADTVSLIEELLHQMNICTCHAYVRDFRRGTLDIATFLTKENPAAVVWDISLPYHLNWTYFQMIRASGVLDGRGVVLTTTNKPRLEEIIGVETDAIEIVGKPYDLDVIVGAVKHALLRAAASV